MAAVRRVCAVIDSLAGTGGAERALAAVTPGLVAAGVAFDVVTLHDRAGLADTVRAGGGTVTVLPRGGPAALRALTHHLRVSRPDLVHTSLWTANQVGRVAAVAARIPVVTSLVNVSYGPEYTDDPSLRAWKVRATQAVDIATARAVRRFHALGEHMAATMARRLLVPRTRIDVIPRGRDPQVLGGREPARRRAVRSALGLDDATPMVLAAARHERQKGLDVLVAATPGLLARRPDAVVVVAGREGNETPALTSALAGVPAGRVRLLGSRADVYDLMAAADVVVVPSRWEGLGSTLIEAMAIGTPLVGSDIAVVRETAGDAVLPVPAEDPEALAAALDRALAGGPDVLARVAEGRRLFAERFTLDRVVAGMLSFYDRALG